LFNNALTTFTQVHASPQAKVFFATMCHEEGLTPLELIKWVRTRWGSMYDLIDRVLVNRAVSYRYCISVNVRTLTFAGC
jgi:hypothetical protein